jgi:MFS family permease
MFAFSVFAGAIGDRLDRRSLMTAAHGANALAVGSILILLITGDIQIWHLYALGAVHGITRAFDNTSRRALMFHLVGAKGLMQAISMEHIGFSTGRIIAPIIAGFLLEVTNSAISSFVLLLGLYSISLYSVFSLQVQGFQDKKPSAPVLSSIVEGFKYAYTTPVIAAVLSVSMVMNVLFQYNIFIPVIAEDYLHVGPFLMGLLAAADGIGKVSGSIVASILAVKIKRHGRIYLLGSLGLALCLLGFAISPWYALSFFLLVGLGFSQIGFSTMQSSIILMSTPTKLHSRVLGVQQLAVGTGQLGSLELGAVVAATSVTFALAVNAAVAICLLAVIAVLMPALRRPLQRPADEPQPLIPSPIPTTDQSAISPRMPGAN